MLTLQRMSVVQRFSVKKNSARLLHIKLVGRAHEASLISVIIWSYIFYSAEYQRHCCLEKKKAGYNEDAL